MNEERPISIEALEELWAAVDERVAEELGEIPPATQSTPGLMAASDKAKLDGMPESLAGEGLSVEDGTLAIGPLVAGNADGPLHSLSGEGWAEQDTTSGKNLLKPMSDATSNGVTLKANSDGSITLNGTATNTAQFFCTLESELPAGAYTWSVDKNFNAILRLDGTPDYGISCSSLTEKTVTTQSTASAWDIRISSGETFNNLTFYPQLEAGTTATPYEPYTGGKPSPNPDYPQAIEVCRGRNLLDINGFENKQILSDGTETPSNKRLLSQLIPIESGNSYTFSFPSGIKFAVYGTYDSSGNFLSYKEVGTTTGQATFIPQGAFVKLYCAKIDTTQVISPSDMVGSQLEQGSVPTPYVPYGHVGLEVQGRNLFDKDTAASSKYIDENGDVASGSNAFVASGFMPVTGGETYTLSGAGSAGTAPRGAFYNESGTFISAFASGPITVEAPSNAAYARVSVRTASLDTAQFERGAAHAHEAYIHTTTPIPLPSKGFAASLPDGTADALALDSAGKWEWVSVTGETHTASSVTNTNERRTMILLNGAAKGVAGTSIPPLYGTHWRAETDTATWYAGVAGISSRGLINVAVSPSITTLEAFNAAFPDFTVLYPLATPTTEHGYIDLPSIPEGATVDIPELREIGASYFVEGAKEVLEACQQWYERGRYEADDIEAAIADLATRVAALENE